MAARITGHLGAIYLDSDTNKIADVFDWTFTPSVELFQCDIKSDKFHKYAATGGGGAVFTARRFHQAASLFNILARTQANVAANAATAQLLFRLDLIDANGSFAQVLGQGYVTGGSLTNPQGPVNDSLEVTFDGVWTQT